mmetsp:Transcript_36082/g.56330  ORF Transcript_36082/g.56330 Transcript_36082/m.56330 type:complete len:302 (-) Transcript_36082:309-1214(-)
MQENERLKKSGVDSDTPNIGRAGSANSAQSAKGSHPPSSQDAKAKRSTAGRSASKSNDEDGPSTKRAKTVDGPSQEITNSTNQERQTNNSPDDAERRGRSPLLSQGENSSPLSLPPIRAVPATPEGPLATLNRAASSDDKDSSKSKTDGDGQAPTLVAGFQAVSSEQRGSASTAAHPQVPSMNMSSILNSAEVAPGPLAVMGREQSAPAPLSLLGREQSGKLSSLYAPEPPEGLGWAGINREDSRDWNALIGSGANQKDGNKEESAFLMSRENSRDVSVLEQGNALFLRSDSSQINLAKDS